MRSTIVLGSSHLCHRDRRWNENVLGTLVRNVSVGGLKAIGVYDRLCSFNMGLSRQKKDKEHHQAIVMLGSNDFESKQPIDWYRQKAMEVSLELSHIVGFLKKRHLLPGSPVYVFMPPPRADPMWEEYAKWLNRFLLQDIKKPTYRGFTPLLLSKQYKTKPGNLLYKIMSSTLFSFVQFLCI